MEASPYNVRIGRPPPTKKGRIGRPPRIMVELGDASPCMILYVLSCSLSGDFMGFEAMSGRKAFGRKTLRILTMFAPSSPPAHLLFCFVWSFSHFPFSPRDEVPCQGGLNSIVYTCSLMFLGVLTAPPVGSPAAQRCSTCMGMRSSHQQTSAAICSRLRARIIEDLQAAAPGARRQPSE